MKTTLLAAVVVWALAPVAPAAQWKVIGPGGGGAQFVPTISPHDPKTVLVGSNMTGAYITHDAGASWRMFNLRGTPGFFVFDPIDPKTIYAQTNIWAHVAGLWRSTDAGQTWRLVHPDPASVVRIDMPDDVAIGRVVTRDGNSDRVTALAVDPSDSKTLYAVMADYHGPGALHVSKDWGRTWRKLADLAGAGLAAGDAHGTRGNQGRKIYIEPRSHDVYVIGANSVGVYRDGVWKPGEPAPGVTAFNDADAGFTNGKLIVYAVDPSKYYVSEDSGQTWRSGGIMPGVSPRLTSVATSLNHPGVAYVSYSLRGDQPLFGIAKSTDFGKAWDLVWKESRTPAPNIYDPWLTERFGPGWGSNNFNLTVSANDPNLCYATNYGKTLRTTDGGKTWDGVYAKKVPGGVTSTGLDVTTCYGVHFDPFDKKRVFISYTDIGLFGSEDGGASWNSMTQTAPPRWVNTTYWMEFDPEVKGRVWAVMSGVHDLPRVYSWRRGSFNGGVTVSDDGGKTWRVAGENLPPSSVTHILLDPKSPAQARVLYITGFGKGVFKSSDGGTTWAMKNEGIATKDPFAWRLARDSKGVLYLVVARHTDNGSFGGDGDGALYRSTDGADHWERLPLPKGVNGPNGVAVDPADPARVYLAAWGRPTEQGTVDGGIFLSSDGGRNWRNVLSRDQHVYDITIDPRDPKVLYACGFESSAWRSKDRGQTWERIRGFNFKWGHRVIPDPYNPKMVYITTFGGSVWYGPADGDPRAVEDIVTPQVAYGR